MEEALHHPVVPEFICEYHSVISGPDGRRYTARAYGLWQGKRIWDGILVFFPEDGQGPILRTGPEQEETSLEELQVWSRALTPTYLSTAMERAHPFWELAPPHHEARV